MNTKTKTISIWLRLRNYIDNYPLFFRTNNGASSEDSNSSEEEKAQEKKQKGDNKQPKDSKKSNKNKTESDNQGNDSSDNQSENQVSNNTSENLFKEVQPINPKLIAYKPTPEDLSLENAAIKLPNLKPSNKGSKKNITINFKTSIINDKSVALTNKSFVASIYVLSYIFPLFGLVLNIIGYMSGYHNEQNYVAKYVRMTLNLSISLMCYYIILFKIAELNPTLANFYVPISEHSWLSFLGGEYSIFWLVFYIVLGFNFIRAVSGKRALHLIAIPILRK